MFDADHDGKTYDRSKDKVRLNRQLRAVFGVMKDGRWRTLDEIATATGQPAASVSARLRDLRKPKFGGFVVVKGRMKDYKGGLWHYRLDATEEEIGRVSD